MKKTTTFILILSLILGAVFIYPGFFFRADAEASSPLVSGKTYRIVCAGSGYWLNLCGNSPDNGTNICQFISSESNKQKWTVTYSEDGGYIINARDHSKKVLHVNSPEKTPENKSNIVISSEDILSHNNQAWYFHHVRDGLYAIRLCSNGLALTATDMDIGSSGGTSASSPGNVIAKEYTGDNFQLWRFHEAE